MGPRLRPTYGMMQKYLTELGFNAQPVDKGFVLFRRPEPDTVLYVKSLPEDEPVRGTDLQMARKFLTEWGLVTDDEFDRFLVESILARYAPRPEPANAHTD
jgi:hypothetical protein